MKKQSLGIYILRLSLTLLIITGVVAGGLAGVNAITADRIAAIQAEKTQKAIAQVLPGPGTPEEVPLPADAPVAAVYRLAPEGEPVRYAVEVRPAGFGGEISMMVGVVETGEILGIAIIDHSETAGLGAVAAADTAKGRQFRDQFPGLSGTLAVKKDGGTVDAISGATVTSRAVTQGVNTALAWVAENG